ncbi:MAG: 1-deoxy-D-xylulose-5-phosphate reductoisomerase [Candidatus Omnitrophica bacterium]|nr:1-deoxy-D-xylulose-5-phosphate reductoisomerase [Candidatus Omnitrophota bacterium]MBU1924952.1 1-deoxy-D-xylulose-5-phosphate reductoisomerase [Candidatus Omnitrophota bacterium]
MKKISVLGSTGSIGTNTLDVVRKNPAEFEVIGLSAYRNVKLFARQIKAFRPRIISVKDESIVRQLEQLVNLSGIKVCTGEEGLIRVATHPAVQTVVVATSGVISLRPTILAVEKGKNIALANKEPLVMAGQILMERVRKNKVRIIPVDSEHSAVFQCLQKEKTKNLKRIYLTASGGPFHNFSKEKLKNVTPDMALRHPKWKMGRKISVDSATLMNKGLEIIEARWLFDVAPDKIEVLIHPEAIIHSMVEFLDGSILAQLGIADMRLPIQYALYYPQRKDYSFGLVDFFKIQKLTFKKPDLNRFPCLKIAKKAASGADTNACVMNAANEVAVTAFLDSNLGFTKIAGVIANVLKKHKPVRNPGIDEIFTVDAWARKEAGLLCSQQ